MEALMNATVGQLIGGGLGIIALLSVFIEFVPIKLNPVSTLLKWIGKRTNKELFDRIDELEDKIDDVSRRQGEAEAVADEREAISCRVRILRFSDELRRNIDHSQESFEQALADVDYYESYCGGHPDFKNNKTVVAKKRIVDAYELRLSHNDFL